MEKECIVCGKSHNRNSDYCSEKCHQKAYYEKNKAKLIEYKKEYYQKNTENYKGYREKWDNNNKEKAKELRKISSKIYYYKNRKQILEKIKEKKLIEENENHIPFID